MKSVETARRCFDEFDQMGKSVFGPFALHHQVPCPGEMHPNINNVLYLLNAGTVPALGGCVSTFRGAHVHRLNKRM